MKQWFERHSTSGNKEQGLPTGGKEAYPRIGS